MKSALLLLVHGSPLPGVNNDIFRVIEDLRYVAEYDLVDAGFLECNEPSVSEAIDRAVGLGAQRVVCVPYFLHAGNHVAVDLPALLEHAQVRHPAVDLRLADYLGRSPVIADIISARAAKAVQTRFS
jgi:sirohydrochlorin ferrochelatase